MSSWDVKMGDISLKIGKDYLVNDEKLIFDVFTADTLDGEKEKVYYFGFEEYGSIELWATLDEVISKGYKVQEYKYID